MKPYQKLVIACSIIAALAACKKEQDFIRDNTTGTGIGVPVSTNTLYNYGTAAAVPVALSTTASVSAANTLAAGTVVKTELQYISVTPVKEVNLYNTIGTGAKTKVATYPYAPSFSTYKRLDTLMVPYTIPVAASGTVIKLDYEIVNQNTQSLTRTAYVKVL